MAFSLTEAPQALLANGVGSALQPEEPKIWGYTMPMVSGICISNVCERPHYIRDQPGAGCMQDRPFNPFIISQFPKGILVKTMH